MSVGRNGKQLASRMIVVDGVGGNPIDALTCGVWPIRPTVVIASTVLARRWAHSPCNLNSGLLLPFYRRDLRAQTSGHPSCPT